MKNGFLFGMVVVAVGAAAIGWLLADKRVVLIVASDSSEITVNRRGATERPSEPTHVAVAAQSLTLDPIPLPTPSDPTNPAPTTAPEAAPAAAEDAAEEPTDAASRPAPEVAGASSEPEAAEAPVDAHAVTPAQTPSNATGEAAEGSAEEASAEKAPTPQPPAVVYEGIGRLGHVALTAVPKKTKKGRRRTIVPPKTLYPVGELKFDETKLARVMKRTDDQVLHCYARSGASRRGQVMAELTLTPEGTVQTAAVSDSTLEDPTVERCVQDLVSGLVFPKGTTNRPARVTYYWKLDPSGA